MTTSNRMLGRVVNYLRMTLKGAVLLFWQCTPHCWMYFQHVCSCSNGAIWESYHPVQPCGSMILMTTMIQVEMVKQCISRSMSLILKPRAWNSSWKRRFSRKWKLKITGIYIFHGKKSTSIHFFFYENKDGASVNANCRYKTDIRHEF